MFITLSLCMWPLLCLSSSIYILIFWSSDPFGIFKLYFHLKLQYLFEITDRYNELIGEISNIDRCLKTLFIVCVSGREPKSVMLGLWSETQRSTILISQPMRSFTILSTLYSWGPILFLNYFLWQFLRIVNMQIGVIIHNVI